MPIVASRGNEIRRLLSELLDPKRRVGAVLRLKSMGARVVPHVAAELGGLDAASRKALGEALAEVNTADGRSLLEHLARLEAESAHDTARPKAPLGQDTSGEDSRALETLRALPAPRPNERAAVSRERGEAHLILARTGSRLARKDLLLSLSTLDKGRARLYCEAAGLIGDEEFLVPLARLMPGLPEAERAIFDIAMREKITARSKILKALPEPARVAVAKALVGAGS
jgi:hypothetical protein